MQFAFAFEVVSAIKANKYPDWGTSTIVYTSIKAPPANAHKRPSFSGPSTQLPPNVLSSFVGPDSELV